MYKPVIILSAFAVLFVFECSGDYILPAYWPSPTRPPIYRFRRSDDQPLWLYKGDDVLRAPSTADDPFLPKYIDDIKLEPNRRVARSLSTPSAVKEGETRPFPTLHIGPTHPAYSLWYDRDLPMPTWLIMSILRAQSTMEPAYTEIPTFNLVDNDSFM